VPAGERLPDDRRLLRLDRGLLRRDAGRDLHLQRHLRRREARLQQRHGLQSAREHLRRDLRLQRLSELLRRQEGRVQARLQRHRALLRRLPEQQLHDDLSDRL
jgi:hypothetical protein